MPAIQDEYDLLILGGGLASLCLSRLLSLELPNARVLTIDTGSGPARRVGESTVEVGAHFLHTRLQMADVLARTQLPKNGLRYWFDDEQRSLPFGQASEDGPATWSHWRSYQLERETFERTLLELNTTAGQTHAYSAQEIEVLPSLAEGPVRHRVAFTLEGERREVRARWRIDARGMGMLKAHGARPDERLTHSACWAWFQGAKSLDDLVPQRPTKLCLGSRQLSTNHFLYEGYWIWTIPLASGLLSVGVVYDHTVLDDPPTDAEGMDTFLRSHRMLEELLGDARRVDFGQLRDYSRRPREIVREDRTGWLGLAAGFADPFYSNGIDMTALACESIAEILRRDLDGIEPEPARISAYNRCVELFYEQVVVFVSGLYATFASHELSVIRYRRDIHVYWTLYTWAYFSGKLFELEFLEAFEPVVEETLERSRFFSRTLRHTYEQLRQRGQLRRCNEKRYTFNQLGFRNFPYVRCEQQLGDPPDLEACRQVVSEIDTGSFLALLDCLFDGDRSPLRRLLFEALHPRYDQVVAAEGEYGFSEAFWSEVFRLLSEGIQQVLAEAGLALGPVELTPALFGKLLKTLLGLCDSPESERVVRELYFAVPRLRDFDPPASTRAEVQPPVRWSVDHTPWLEEPPNFQTVYELLGAPWLRGEGGTFSGK